MNLKPLHGVGRGLVYVMPSRDFCLGDFRYENTLLIPFLCFRQRKDRMDCVLLTVKAKKEMCFALLLQTSPSGG